MSAKNGQKNPLEYIPLCEASRQSGYTPEYLNCLARQGKLKAEKMGRNWYTTLAWLDDFIQSTAVAKKGKIRKIDSEIQEYTSEKVCSRENDAVVEPAAFPETEPAEKDENFLSEKAEIKFQSRWKMVNTFAATLVFIFLLFGIFQVGRFTKSNNFGTGGLFENSANDYLLEGEYPKWISEENGIVQGEEIVAAIIGPQSGPALVSENFKIREIKFGGAIAMASALENPNFEISDIRSEVMTTNDKEENKLLIRWRTSKLALSSIEYSPMNGSNPKKLREDSYGFGHSVILSDLEPGTAYTYVVKSKDKWANEISSERYSAYTGSKTVSVFDLIINAIKEVFGWAVKE